MNYEWVIGRYEGHRASAVADLGYGHAAYIILSDEGRGQSRVLEAAFRRPVDGPRPVHLWEVTNVTKLKELEDIHARRTGIKER